MHAHHAVAAPTRAYRLTSLRVALNFTRPAGPQARKREREAEAALLRTGGAGEDHEWLATPRASETRAAGPGSAASARPPAAGGFPLGRSLSTSAVDEPLGAGRARGAAGEEAASMPLLIAKMQVALLCVGEGLLGRPFPSHPGASGGRGC